MQLSADPFDLLRQRQQGHAPLRDESRVTARGPPVVWLRLAADLPGHDQRAVITAGDVVFDQRGL